MQHPRHLDIFCHATNNSQHTVKHHSQRDMDSERNPTAHMLEHAVRLLSRYGVQLLIPLSNVAPRLGALHLSGRNSVSYSFQISKWFYTQLRVTFKRTNTRSLCSVSHDSCRFTASKKIRPSCLCTNVSNVFMNRSRLSMPSAVVISLSASEQPP